jgi:PAS domain S-box-containing protein
MANSDDSERALRDSENKYRQIFSTSRDACFLFDLQTLDILDVNPAASTLYGYLREDFLRMKMSAVWAEPAQSIASMREMVNSAITFVPLRYHKKKNGAVFPVEVTPANFQWNGRKVIFGAIRDISERVKAEKDLERSPKLTHLCSERMTHV